MKIQMPAQPTMWFCPVCGKYDTPESKEPMVTPEHRSYRGIDIGDCEGDMIPLYSEGAIREANK